MFLDAICNISMCGYLLFFSAYMCISSQSPFHLKDIYKTEHFHYVYCFVCHLKCIKHKIQIFTAHKHAFHSLVMIVIGMIMIVTTANEQKNCGSCSLRRPIMNWTEFYQHKIETIIWWQNLVNITTEWCEQISCFVIVHVRFLSSSITNELLDLQQIFLLNGSNM